MPDFIALRHDLITSILKRDGVHDPRILDAIGRVPRERFVPPALADRAYDDAPLPIGGGQTISQPSLVALMIEAADIKDGARVLEVGTGSGYAAALLACVAGRVITLERDPDLARAAELRLHAEGFRNVGVHAADGTLGWRAEAPYAAILVAAGAPSIPPSLQAQLEIGGHLIIPVGPAGEQELLQCTRLGPDDYRTRTLGPVRFVRLIGAEAWDETPWPRYVPKTPET